MLTKSLFAFLLVVAMLAVAADAITYPSKRNVTLDCTMTDPTEKQWVPTAQFSNAEEQTMATIRNKYRKFLTTQAAALGCQEKHLAACLRVESNGAGFSRYDVCAWLCDLWCGAERSGNWMHALCIVTQRVYSHRSNTQRFRCLLFFRESGAWMYTRLSHT